MKYRVEARIYRRGKPIKRTRTVEAESIEHAREIAGRLISQADNVRADHVYCDYVTEIRLTNCPTLALLREHLPPEIMQIVDNARGKSRSVRLEMVNPGYELYLDEDARYTFIHNGVTHSVRMMGEWNMQQPHLKDANPNVGKRVPIPAGMWVVESDYFCGHKTVTVYHGSIEQLPQER